MSLSEIMAGALEAVQAVAGESIVYRIGSTELEIVGIPGRTLFAGVDAERLLTQYDAQDWLISPFVLIVDGSVVIPEAGHQIDFTDGDTVRTYEAMLQGDRCYRLDPHHRLLRVYTKLVSTRPA